MEFIGLHATISLAIWRDLVSSPKSNKTLANLSVSHSFIIVAAEKSPVPAVRPV